MTKNNILIMHHMTRRTIHTHFEKGSSQGSLFLFLDKIYGERRLSKKKMNEQEALKILQKRFSDELKDINEIIDNFREGLKSFEVFKSSTSHSV